MTPTEWWCGIADPAIEDDADVELDDIAVLDARAPPMPWTTSSLDRDADIARKAAVIEEGAADIGLVHEGGGGAIDLAGGDAGLDEGAGAIENLAGDAAGEAHFFDFLGVFLWESPLGGSIGPIRPIGL